MIPRRSINQPRKRMLLRGAGAVRHRPSRPGWIGWKRAAARALKRVQADDDALLAPGTQLQDADVDAVYLPIGNRESLRKLKTHGSAEHLHGVSAHANVCDTFAVACGAHMDFARTTHLDALSNHYLFITICDAVLDHPTRGAAGRRSRSWIFTAIKKHARPGFPPALVPIRTEQVKEPGFGVF